jgi:hypothetical protein
MLASIINYSRIDVPLPAQPSGPTNLFIYSGEVSFNASSGGGTDFRDTLFIPLETASAVTDPSTQIMGWGGAHQASGPASVPQPVVLPTSWNNGGSGGEPVVAINGPSLAYITSAAVPQGGNPGLYIQASVTVQHGSLLNAQFYCAMLVKF